MTISEKLDALKENYIKAMDKLNPQEDNGYVWWERENQCQEWSEKQWSVLDGLKVNGAGKGFFEYEFK